MTHSQQPSIEVLQTLRKWFLDKNQIGDMLSVSVLDTALNIIKALPQGASVETTTDELLATLPHMWYVTFVNMTTYFVAETREKTATGKTPREALLALKEKLVSKETIY